MSRGCDLTPPRSALEAARAIFFPYVAERKTELASRSIRLAHYCAAESAVSIIRNQEIWMRNAAVMNDFTEVEYGLRLLMESYQRGAGAEFRKAIDAALPGTVEKVDDLLESYRWELRGETYLTSVTEHHPTENALGRLSMWRSYGGSTGVALVLRPEAMSIPDDSLAGFAHPVLYADEPAFEKYMLRLADSISQGRDFIRGQGQDWFVNWLQFLLRSTVLSTKHPGFVEEREWRVIHSPVTVNSTFLEREILTINSVPQIIYKIPLRESSDPTLGGLNVPSLVERVIIGPTQHPTVVGAAFVALLAERGVADAKDRVCLSAIPLRQP